MNNSTITIYKDDGYTNIYHSFDLEKTNLNLLKTKLCCFNMYDSIISVNLCGYEKFCGKPNENNWAEDWKKDFKLFKVSCRVGKMENLISAKEEEKLAEALRKKLGQITASISLQKEEEIKKQMLTTSGQTTSPYVSKIKNTQNMGLKAIQKEMKLEDLIAGEEKVKEEEEIHSIVQKIQEEKEKADCLETNIKARDLDANILQDRRSAENEIKVLKAEAIQEIVAKRAKMKKLISLMRTKAQIRKAKYQQELTSLRNKMAQEQMKSNKIGNIEYCKKGKFDEVYREKYCNKNYVDDFVNYRECKTNEFCYMCCEFEFGNMHIEKRQLCYDMCDLKENKEIKKSIKIEKKKDPTSLPFMWE
jgi:hypothetical protein